MSERDRLCLENVLLQLDQEELKLGLLPNAVRQQVKLQLDQEELK